MSIMFAAPLSMHLDPGILPGVSQLPTGWYAVDPGKVMDCYYGPFDTQDAAIQFTLGHENGLGDELIVFVGRFVELHDK